MNEVHKLDSIIIFFSERCISGIDFLYSDQTKLSTGQSNYMSQLKGQDILFLRDRKLSEVHSYGKFVADFMIFCAIDENDSNESFVKEQERQRERPGSCIFVGGDLNQKPDKVVNVLGKKIVSFYGDYAIYNSWYCLLNFGVNISN